MDPEANPAKKVVDGMNNVAEDVSKGCTEMVDADTKFEDFEIDPWNAWANDAWWWGGWVWWAWSLSAFFFWAVFLFQWAFVFSQYGPFSACVTGPRDQPDGFLSTNQSCTPGSYSTPTIPALVLTSMSFWALLLYRPTVSWFTRGMFQARRFDATHLAMFLIIAAFFVENGNDWDVFNTKQRDNIQQNPVPNVNNTIYTPDWRRNPNDPPQGASMGFAIAAVLTWVLTYLPAFFIRYSKNSSTYESAYAWAGTSLTLVFIYISLATNVGPVWPYANLSPNDANPQILSYASKQYVLATVVFWSLGAATTVVLFMYTFYDYFSAGYERLMG